MPINPSSPSFFTISYGNRFSWSSSSATGLTSASAKSRTRRRMFCCSSVSSKFTGRVMLSVRETPPGGPQHRALDAGPVLRRVDPVRLAEAGDGGLEHGRNGRSPARSARAPDRRDRPRGPQAAALVQHRREPGALRRAVVAQGHEIHRLDRAEALLEAPAEQGRSQRYEQGQRLLRPPEQRLHVLLT